MEDSKEELGNCAENLPQRAALPSRGDAIRRHDLCEIEHGGAKAFGDLLRVSLLVATRIEPGWLPSFVLVNARSILPLFDSLFTLGH